MSKIYTNISWETLLDFWQKDTRIIFIVFEIKTHWNSFQLADSVPFYVLPNAANVNKNKEIEACFKIIPNFSTVVKS